MKLRNLTRAPAFQRLVGTLAAEYLRLVWWTNRFSYQPADFYQQLDPHLPAIIAFWHGQHFMIPFLRRDYHRAKVLISRHRDGEMNAIAAERLGVGTVRGSGDHGAEFHRKGGVAAFKSMLQPLEDGYNMATPADVPKVSRVPGRGIILLARESGRSILSFPLATRPFTPLNNCVHRGDRSLF